MYECIMRFDRQDKAVSPIIATILLIAITIVLAATLYSLLGGYVSLISAPTPQASMTITNQTQQNSNDGVYTIYISGVNQNISLSKVTLEFQSSNGNVTEIPLTQGTIETQYWKVTVNGPDYLSALTVITISSLPNNGNPFIKFVKLVDTVTDGTIASQSVGLASATS
ncbi:type IV pilin [Thermoplasma sp. Kam2015]|nr:type IV pilin [Thermoplasma sp. Kam2015]